MDFSFFGARLCLMANAMGKIIVTSALPYSEAVPHLGNLVGSILPADVFYKYTQMDGRDSIFICGSDQHGTPIEIRAIKLGITPEELSDKVHGEIKSALERFGCSFTYYGKTGSESNRKTVYEIFESLRKNNYITEAESVMPYCNIDKRFLTDRLIEGKCPFCGYDKARGDQCDNCGRLLTPKELIDPYCTLCKNKDITFRKTVNLAIDLKALQPYIETFVKERSKNDWSKNATNKTLSYLEQGLEPREITRDMDWGFKVPMKGFEDKVFYVWFDAVIGYIGITREWSEKWQEYWKAPDTRLIQFMGKDNIEFHTMMWPGILIGSESGYVLPETIKAYEYLTAKGLKFSKSNGVGLNIENALGIAEADYWRFALIYLLPETSDTDFTIAGFVEIVNNIVNDKIGNFIHRVLTLAKNNPALFEGAVKVQEEYAGKTQGIIEKYTDNFEKFRLREALREFVSLAEYGNEIMSNSKPWELAKRDPKEFARVMKSLIRMAYYIGVLMWPFMPSHSEDILSYFGHKGRPSIKGLEGGISASGLDSLKPAFSKISDKQLEMLEGFGED